MDAEEDCLRVTVPDILIFPKNRRTETPLLRRQSAHRIKNEAYSWFYLAKTKEAIS